MWLLHPCRFDPYHEPERLPFGQGRSPDSLPFLFPIWLRNEASTVTAMELANHHVADDHSVYTSQRSRSQTLGREELIDAVTSTSPSLGVDRSGLTMLSSFMSFFPMSQRCRLQLNPLLLPNMVHWAATSFPLLLKVITYLTSHATRTSA